MGALLGLDIGQRRVGVATAEESLDLATSLETLEIKNRNDLLRHLTRLVQEYRPVKIVVGLPKTLKGEIGPSAQLIIDQVEWLKSQMSQAGAEWVFWDERLTTKEAEQVLFEAGVGHMKRKRVQDQLAAQIILQSYLDYHKRKEGNS